MQLMREVLKERAHSLKQIEEMIKQSQQAISQAKARQSEKLESIQGAFRELYDLLSQKETQLCN